MIWRPPGTPHFGGHIERLIGTQMGAVHLLPGTTFSNPPEPARRQTAASRRRRERRPNLSAMGKADNLKGVNSRKALGSEEGSETWHDH